MEPEDKIPQDGQTNTEPVTENEEVKQPEGEGLQVEKVEEEVEGLKLAENKEDGAKEEGVKEDGAPEKYEDFTAPDGVTIKPEQVESFSSLAKELNLSQENAQKLLDIQSNIVLEEIKAQEEAFEENQKSWLETAKTDKEIGGANFEKNVGLASKAFQKLASPELQQFLADSKLTNHPELIRHFYRLEKLIGEDSVVPGTPGMKPKNKTINYDIVDRS